ncbi:hypothetical protein HW49_05305 [Porphyromonadaceae bacterium COT-184 OH4590]|nr:hypothetical protein HW49_05305 [Porphyromonadaceae bacterium COT-184 OH4590]
MLLINLLIITNLIYKSKKVIVMKKIFNFVAVAITAFSLSLVSCKEDPATPLAVNMSEGKTATISGTLLVNPNLSAGTPTYKGMETKILVSVPYAEIFEDAKAKGSWSTVVSSDNKGEFTVTVPASVKGVTVTFTASDVRGEQVNSAGKSIKGVWKFRIAGENVTSGKTVVKEQTIGSFTALKEDGSEVY